MSYCRNNGRDSDVYVIEAYKGLVCIGCVQRTKKDGWSYNTKSHKQMINHLLMHRRKGDKVPDNALARLRFELRNGYKVGDEMIPAAWDGK